MSGNPMGSGSKKNRNAIRRWLVTECSASQEVPFTRHQYIRAINNNENQFLPNFIQLKH